MATYVKRLGYYEHVCQSVSLSSYGKAVKVNEEPVKQLLAHLFIHSKVSLSPSLSLLVHPSSLITYSPPHRCDLALADAEL